jgi:hypothetical protein
MKDRTFPQPRKLLGAPESSRSGTADRSIREAVASDSEKAVKDPVSLLQQDVHGPSQLRSWTLDERAVSCDEPPTNPTDTPPPSEKN